MITIGELVNEDVFGNAQQCTLTLSGDMPVREALSRMQERGCDSIAVACDIESGHAVLSKEELLNALLLELETVQRRVNELQEQFSGVVTDQLELIEESARAINDNEREKLQSAVENMTEGLIILGRNNTVENANPAARILMGLDRDDELATLAKSVERIGLGRLVAEGTSDDDHAAGEITLKSPVGSSLQISWNRMTDRWGYFLGNVVTIRDITEQLRAETTKSEFIAAISHELRTPLTSIQNCVSNMQAGITGCISPKGHEYLDAMNQDARRLTNLVNDLLDIAKLEANNLPINRRVTSIADLVSEAVASAANRAQQAGITLCSKICCRIPPVCVVDSARIRQVLDNLIDNAIKFTPEGGQVTVGVFDRADRVVTVVEDTGPGVNADMHKHIFNKFYQVARQAGPGYKGSGLGLAICNGIIAAHGGDIWVENGQQKGSRFCFALPRVDPFIVLNKHLQGLVKSPGIAEEGVAMIIVRLDIPPKPDEQLTAAARAILGQLLTESGHLLTEDGDMAVQTEDVEIVFVVQGPKKRRIDSIRAKIGKIVANNIRKNYGTAGIVPMLGAGIYPDDCADIRDMEEIVRRRAERVPGSADNMSLIDSD